MWQPKSGRRIRDDVWTWPDEHRIHDEARHCGGGGPNCAANADSQDGRMGGAASADGGRECAWHGADDQDGVCGEQRADGDQDGGDDGPDANSNWQRPRRPRLRPAD